MTRNGKLSIKKGVFTDMVSFKQWEQAEKLSEGSPMDIPSDRNTVFHHGIQPDVAFRCKGNSMKPTFYNGETVFIHKQDDFSDGQIVAVRIGAGMTLKRLYRLSDGFLLVPDNKQFKPLKITGNDAESVKVYGVAVARQGRQG